MHRYEGTLERFTGDGVMVFFNDPIPCDDAAERARADGDRDPRCRPRARRGWIPRDGHDLALGTGIAQGFATLGRIGFEGRFDYAAIGSVTNLAARLCSDAQPWQVLVTDRVLAAVENVAVSEFVGDLQPKGFSRSVRIHNIIGLRREHMTATTEPGRGCRLYAMDEDERFDVFEKLRVDAVGMGVDAARPSTTNRLSWSRRSAPNRTTAGSGTVMQAMEERALFLLLLLRQPRLRMIYVTSQPVSESIIEYYLGLLPGVIPAMPAPGCRWSPSVTHHRIRSARNCSRGRASAPHPVLIPNRTRHMIPYNTTALERDVALSLGLPMYGADPRLEELGSKTGCRRMFEELGRAASSGGAGPPHGRGHRRPACSECARGGRR